MIRFFLVLLIVSLVMIAAVWLMADGGWIPEIPSFFFQTAGFLLFGTGLLYIYLYKFDKPDFFIQLYLLTMAVKLLAYGAYNFFMIMEDRTGAVYNVTWFMALYFIFTALEIGFLYQKISRQ
ncbi:MAG TPA: hypothetical protein VFZ52_14640 [Chryseolinea sp.]